MKIVIATGIYPPDIGGTATYSYELKKVLRDEGHDVTVITYGPPYYDDGVLRVSGEGGAFIRWNNYARTLRNVGKDADVIIALSSVSVGIPLMMANIKKPKKILRLGGEFFWERYTDAGGVKSLKDWQASMFGFWRTMHAIFMGRILRSFDTLVYSTEMQKNLHDQYFSSLPHSIVLENAIPSGDPKKHQKHTPMKLLCLSRFVGFKNLFALIEALSKMTNVTLTMIGDGPLKLQLHSLAAKRGVNERIRWWGTTEERGRVFSDHDLLVIPSITDISPNAALEARSTGLPVLLSEETGLSERLHAGMVVRKIRTAQEIAAAIQDCNERYDAIASEAAMPTISRPWSMVADEWITLLSS